MNWHFDHEKEDLFEALGLKKETVSLKGLKNEANIEKFCVKVALMIYSVCDHLENQFLTGLESFLMFVFLHDSKPSQSIEVIANRLYNLYSQRYKGDFHKFKHDIMKLMQLLLSDVEFRTEMVPKLFDKLTGPSPTTEVN